MKDDSGPAFPLPWAPRMPGETLPPMPPQGMTLRDYFAGQAVGALLTQIVFGANRYDIVAHDAYKVADAMLEARKK